MSSGSTPSRPTLDLASRVVVATGSVRRLGSVAMVIPDLTTEFSLNLRSVFPHISVPLRVSTTIQPNAVPLGMDVDFTVAVAALVVRRNRNRRVYPDSLVMTLVMRRRATSKGLLASTFTAADVIF